MAQLRRQRQQSRLFAARTFLVENLASGRADGHAGGHAQANAAHLCQVRALAAKLHRHTARLGS